MFMSGDERLPARTWRVARVTTNYLYDGMNTIEELDGSGSLSARYTGTEEVDEPLARSSSVIKTYYEQDGIGSVTSLTDSTGTTAGSYEYDSFGDLKTTTGTLSSPLQYTAREYDAETGIYFYRARYYDPLTGRFSGEDPMGFGAGVNFYKYVQNNPINLSDPLGLLHLLIWNQTGSAGKGNWGHVAILLDDGTYISWWPGAPDDPNNPNTVYEDGGLHWARNARLPGYADDVAGEGHGPDEDIYINSLDEEAMKKWWNEFQKNKTWDSYHRNCSNAAMQALQAGGASNNLKPKRNWVEPTSPEDVLDYALQLELYNHHPWVHYLYRF